MAVVDDEESLRHYMSQAVDVDREMTTSGQEVAILVDQFLEDAYEVDVDAVADGERVVIGGILQHIEEAGIHSGDSACVLPPYKISGYHLSIIREYTEKLGLALGVRGLMNVQYAIKDDVVYVIEVNPRASRTVPFVSKATGVPLAKMAAWVMAGKSLEEVGLLEEPEVRGFFVKEAVLPWKKLSGADTLLGPEMRSTGEVMGHAHNFGHAFAKSQLGAEYRLPTDGGVLITVNDYDKGAALKLARDFSRMGFDLYATSGTAALIQRVGLPVVVLTKAAASEASLHSPGNGAYSTLDAMRDGKIDLIINTPLGPHSRADGQKIRTLATRMEIPLITTLSAAQAAGVLSLEEGLRFAARRGSLMAALQDGNSPDSAALDALDAAFAGVATAPPSISLVNQVTGRVLGPGETLDGAHWRRQAGEPAAFGGCVETLAELGVDVIVEAGPDQVLGPQAAAAWPKSSDDAGAPVVLASLDRASANGDTFLASVAQAYEAGLTPEFRGLFAGEERRRISLPGYPFQRRRFWFQER